MPTTETVESPAVGILRLQSKSKKDKNYVWTPADVRGLADQAVAYLEQRIEAVEAIAGGVSPGDRERLVAKIDRLEAKENKSDAEYLELAVAERKLRDAEQRESVAKHRTDLSQKMLAEELTLWGLTIIQACAAANAAELFDELHALLKPYLLDRPAREVIGNIPAYNNAVYFTFWHRPTPADVMSGAVDGTASARELVNAIRDQLKGSAFAKRGKA